MGLFDLFRSKNKDGEDATDDAIDRQMAEVVRPSRRFSDLEEPERIQRTQQVLQGVAAGFDGAKIKSNPDDDEIELRARIEGTPVRVSLDYDGGWISPELKFENRTGSLSVLRDHEAIEKTKEDEDDDWADEDELRVFLAKGIYIEGLEDDINEESATIQALGPETRRELFETMERLQFSVIQAWSDGMSASIDPNFPDLDDPVAYITDIMKFMHRLATAMTTGDRDMASEPKVIIRGRVEVNGQVLEPTQSAAPAIERVQCSYCNTKFLPGLTTNCPNCGAAS